MSLNQQIKGRIHRKGQTKKVTMITLKKEVMSPDNKRWNEFTARLEGKEGCNFEQKVKNDPSSITWKCSSERTRPLATAILEKMGNIDIPKTLEFFDKHGGHCDCEILFNVNR